MSEPNVSINELISLSKDVSKLPLIVFSIAYFVWAYIISITKESSIPQLDDLVVYLVIYLPIFFIINCMLVGRCSMYVWFLAISVIGVSTFIFLKRKTIDTPTTKSSTVPITPPVTEPIVPVTEPIVPVTAPVTNTPVTEPVTNTPVTEPVTNTPVTEPVTNNNNFPSA